MRCELLHYCVKMKVKVTHQVVRPALGGEFWIPVLALDLHWHSHARAISITFVLEISPAPSPSSYSELLQMYKN